MPDRTLAWSGVFIDSIKQTRRSVSVIYSGVVSRCGPPRRAKPTMNFRMAVERSSDG